MVFRIPLFADLLSGAQHDQHDASAVRNPEFRHLPTGTSFELVGSTSVIYFSQHQALMLAMTTPHIT